MNHDVDTIFKRPKQYGGRNSIIANYRHTIFVGNVSYLFILQNIVFGISNAFYVDKTRIVLDCLGKILRLGGVNESNLDTQFGKCLAKQRDCPPVKRARRYDMTSCTANIKDAHIGCRLA